VRLGIDGVAHIFRDPAEIVMGAGWIGSGFSCIGHIGSLTEALADGNRARRISLIGAVDRYDW
jgi:hypothetical protein